jgi:LysM repeat protein
MFGKEPQYIFGMHDRGGESDMAATGKKAWVLISEETGHNPTHTGGTDYSALSRDGFGVIVRLNNGYEPRGTLPKSAHYEDFATRCANWVAGSSGCHIWIIGNEMNYSIEWPKEDGNPETITPTRYAKCFKLCRDKIRSLPGHEMDQIVVGAVAPWNVDAEMGWIEYFVDVLNRLEGQCDGIAIHTYTHGSGVDLISSPAKMDPPHQDRHYQFYCYRDFMNAIPDNARHLPVYVTETDQDDAWLNANNGWVQAAYQEIDNWNKTIGNQQIRCLILYRWQGDKYSIQGKEGVLNDWKKAMRNEYVWHPKPEYKAVFLDFDFPTVVTAGQQFSGSVHVRNDSSMIWRMFSDHPVRVGYHWLKDGERVKIEDMRTPLPHDVLGGQSVELNKVMATAPAESGTYTLQLDMVHELLTWFADKGSTPLEVGIEVRARDEQVTTYTVKAGDTLAQIAKALYGDPSLYDIIANANGILDPSIIQVGQVLVIPALREEMPEVKPEDFGLGIEMIGSPFFSKRKERPLVIVNHATANSSLDGLNRWFNDERAKVSAHFGIGKDGTVVQYVDEAWMAWHAGRSEWRGREHVNWFSLGIELVNLNDGVDPYPEAQHEANVALNVYLCVKWGITPDAEHIITHRDISEHLTGKTDPLGYDMDRLRREVAALVREHSNP